MSTAMQSEATVTVSRSQTRTHHHQCAAVQDHEDDHEHSALPLMELLTPGIADQGLSYSMRPIIATPCTEEPTKTSSSSLVRDNA